MTVREMFASEPRLSNPPSDTKHTSCYFGHVGLQRYGGVIDHWQSVYTCGKSRPFPRRVYHVSTARDMFVPSTIMFTYEWLFCPSQCV